MKSSPVYTVKEATLKLMKYCTYQERCHTEVEKRLQQYALTPLERQEVITNLISEDFLNEERFAKAFVNDKYKLNRWGRVRIQNELKSRKISDYLIQKALGEIDESLYLENFDHLFKKRFKAVKETNPWKKKKKIADYLYRRGYESELIFGELEKHF